MQNKNFLFMVCGLKKGSEERSERGRRGEGGSEGRREVAADE